LGVWLTALACTVSCTLGGGRLSAATFETIGTHPDAAAQPTATGRTISTLRPFRGKIYVGYGDYDANTGPINVRAFNVTSGSFTAPLLSALTEHILLYREIGGKLYAPIIDTSAGGGGATGFAVGTPSGDTETWQNVLPVGGIHMFDINSLDGTSLMMTGAVTGPTFAGQAWYSPDGVSNWTVSLAVPPRQAGDFTRLYGLGNYQGKLWTQARDTPSRTNPPYSEVWDGTSWSHGPDLLPPDGQTVWRPEEFAGQMVYLTLHNGFQISRMFKFDGTTAGQAYVDSTGNAGSLFRDYAVAGDYLYGLLSDGRLIETRDLSQWTVFDTAPASARSLTVLDGKLYIGTDSAQLLRYTSVVPEAFVVGDMDGDGDVDSFDIQPFELALTDEAAFKSLFPAIVDFTERGDVNGDGDFDSFDIQSFEALLTTSSLSIDAAASAAVPEPPSIALLTLGLGLFALRSIKRFGAACR